MNQMGKNLNKCCSLAIGTGDPNLKNRNSTSESTGLMRSRARHLQANLWDELKGVPRQLPVARLASGMALFAASVGQLLPRKQRGLLLDPNWRLLMGGRERLEPRKCQQKRLGQPPRLVIFNVRLFPHRPAVQSVRRGFV